MADNFNRNLKTKLLFHHIYLELRVLKKTVTLQKKAFSLGGNKHLYLHYDLESSIKVVFVGQRC